MKFSIITPTHNPKYLYELYVSIVNQTYKNWEWIIVCNNGAVISNLPEDERIKIYDLPFETDFIGRIKKYAFSLGTGDVLVEVDHDDLLHENCLQELYNAFLDDSIGFVYSNSVTLGPFLPYADGLGWEYRPHGEYMEILSFKPDAGSVSFIWFAPNHVRAWKKDAYIQVGGHNENLKVLDDQELMLRTYLITKFYHIDKPLYYYRVSEDNTYIKPDINGGIQVNTVEIYNYYAQKLAERDADLNNLMKIDLGGGFNKPEGYVGLDLEGSDITCDLNKGIPLPDNSCGVVRCNDILEHLPDKHFIMSEIWRVLADGGWLFVSVPSTDGRGAFMDPTHISYWNQNSFWYWTRRESAQYIRNDKIKFQEFRLETIFPNDWCRENNISYVVAYLRAIKSTARRPVSQKI